jgi:hypothetical protein
VYKSTNTALGTAATASARQVCLNTINIPNVQSLFDREETSPTIGSSNFVISPNVPGQAEVFLICGEASVLSINQAGVANPSRALSATVARSDATFSSIYSTGWANWDLSTASSTGLPVLGSTFLRARNGTANFGFAFTHKSTP